MKQPGGDRGAAKTRTLLSLLSIAALFFIAIIFRRSLWP